MTYGQARGARRSAYRFRSNYHARTCADEACEPPSDVRLGLEGHHTRAEGAECSGAVSQVRSHVEDQVAWMNQRAVELA